LVATAYQIRDAHLHERGGDICVERCRIPANPTASRHPLNGKRDDATVMILQFF